MLDFCGLMLLFNQKHLQEFIILEKVVELDMEGEMNGAGTGELESNGNVGVSSRMTGQLSDYFSWNVVCDGKIEWSV